MNATYLLTWIVFLLHGAAGYRLVCVYTNWSQYRPEGGKFLPEDIDPSMCTHLIYVYAKLQGNKLASVEWNDDGNAWREGMYQRVNALKQYNPDLKTLLGVGGWMMGSKDFSRMASTRRSRRMFAKSAIDFLRKRDFDGLTIDWQHPTKRGGRRKDRVNFSLLLQELRRAFDKESKQTRQPNLLLTAGVSASKYIIDSAYEVENVSKYTDFINVFAYDLHGPWDNFTGHPSPLYAREDELGPAADINIDSSMKHWITNGVDRSKLVLGISTYGRTFTLMEPRYNGYGVPTTGPGTAREFTREPGMIAYYERCNQYFDAPRMWDKQSRVAYWHTGDQWIAGDDIESVKHKVYWARRNGVDGFLLWTLDTDDFSGTCNTGQYALHSALKNELDNPTQPPTTLPTTDVTTTAEQVTETSSSVIVTPDSLMTVLPRHLFTKIPVRKPKTRLPDKKMNFERKTKPKPVVNKSKLQPKAKTKQSVVQPKDRAKQNKQIKDLAGNTNSNKFAKVEKPNPKKKPNIKKPIQSSQKQKQALSIQRNIRRQKTTRPPTTTPTTIKTTPKATTKKKITIKKQTGSIPIKKLPQKDKNITDKSPKGANNKVQPKQTGNTSSKPKKIVNRLKGRRRKLTREQRLRIIKHRRRILMRKKNAKKRNTTTPIPVKKTTQKQPNNA